MKKAAVYIGNDSYEHEQRYKTLIEDLSAKGFELYRVHAKEDIVQDTELLLSVGGDGTFLSAADLVAGYDLPVVGVNLGRLGFLSENRPEDVAEDLQNGDYTLEDRSMLEVVDRDSLLPAEYRHALNEISVRRSGPSMLEIEVSVDGVMLPTYWADGLIISTSSGSTAYSLSVGGPIVLPEAKVLIISPIAPHNLNVRPLVIPDTSKVTLRMSSRDDGFVYSADNRSVRMNPGTQLSVSLAQFSLKRVRLKRSNFINALTEKLFWGEDVRNIK